MLIISVVVMIVSITSSHELMDNGQGKILVENSGTTDIVITVTVDSSSCPSADDACASCPSVQWAFNRMSISTGMDYTVSNPCNSDSSSPFTFNLTIATLTADTAGEYSAVFTYLLGTTETLDGIFITVPGEQAV